MCKNCIKKMIVLCFCLLLCFCLASCDSSEYKQAEKYYNAGEYSAALEIYLALGDYEDSLNKANLCKYEIANIYFEETKYSDALDIYKELGEYEDVSEKIKTCEKEIGMSTNADYDFIDTLEKSVLERLEKSSDTEQTVLVNAEMAYMERFKNESFYDETLQEISNLYLEGLYKQQDALKAEYQYEYQVFWQEGLVKRYEALKRLYEEYDFLSDNVDFIATYIMQYDEQKDLRDAYLAIEEDLHTQTTSEEFEYEYDYSEYEQSVIVSFTLINNTKYTYSTVFDFTFLSNDDIIFYNTSEYIENIKPGNSYIVSVYVDGKDCKTDGFGFEWFNYYTDVKYANTKSENSGFDITDEEKEQYTNVLNIVNSIRQIHINPNSIELLGAVTTGKRTTVYISYLGMDDITVYTDYFWKNLDESYISNKYGEENYTGFGTPVEKMDLEEILYFENSGAYIETLVPSNNIDVSY